MKKTIFTLCAILLGSFSTLTAQVKLQSDNVDEVLKAMTLEEKAMLVVGGNRQIASTGDNGMVGGHAHRVPGAAGTTQSIPPPRHPLYGAHRRSCRRENQSEARQLLEHLLLHRLPRGHGSRLHLEHAARGGGGPVHRQRGAGIWLRRAARPRHEHPPLAALWP